MTIAQDEITFTEAPPLSLYIHFPWCVAKCPYCDFNSHALKNDLPEQAYIEKVIADAKQSLDLFHAGLADRPIQTIFMGGGTPSLFSGAALADCLQQLNALLPFADDIEITLEANPGTLEQDRFQEYRQAGINRLSLGVQSFDDLMLKKLGRIHGALEARLAIEAAQQADFDSFNIDIMFALPEQSIKQAFADLETALSFAPAHLSWYQLTLEPNTVFYQQKPALPTHDVTADMHQFGCQKIKDHGFDNYEVSAYAKDGKVCRHNINYWQYGDYLGIGAGAHSKLTNWQNKSITRCMKIKHPKRYLSADGDFIQSQQTVNPQACAFEFMLNALRLNKPLPLALFSSRTGLPVSIIESPVKAAIAQGMLTNDDGVLSKTTLGERFVDEIVQLFLHH